MSRLEKIKERIEEILPYIHEPNVRAATKTLFFVKDLPHIISRLESAEKVIAFYAQLENEKRYMKSSGVKYLSAQDWLRDNV